jgi:hypothetical protein
VKRCCLLLAAPVAVVVVLTSSVVLNGSVLVAVAVTAGLAAVLAYALADAVRSAPVEAAWQAAAGVFGVSVAAGALGVVAGGTAAAVLVLLVAAAAGAAGLRWYLRRLVRERRELDAVLDEADGNPGGPLHRFSVPASLLPTPALAREWQRTTVALESAWGPAAWDDVVRRRQELLDELERRNPDGFARWLAAGAPLGGPGTVLDG